MLWNPILTFVPPLIILNLHIQDLVAQTWKWIIYQKSEAKLKRSSLAIYKSRNTEMENRIRGM